MFKVVKEVRWEAAHRLLDYEGKCANIHGHSYRAIFTFKSAFGFEKSELNKDGMVIDFSILKEKIQGWIDTYWDHALILCAKDPLVNIIYSQRYFVLDGNPTAENMAELLFNYFRSSFRNIDLVSVEVFEGTKSSAIYEEK